MTSAPSSGGTPTRILTGTFRDRESAERAHEVLLRREYSGADIDIVMSEETRHHHFPIAEADDGSEVGEKVAKRGAVGAAIGGTAGALIGVLAAAGTLAIPGLGLVLAGPIAAGLTGLAAGGAAGGVAGALVGAGVPEEEARGYESDVQEGNILVGVRPRSADEATAIAREWKEAGAVRVRGLPERGEE